MNLDTTENELELIYRSLLNKEFVARQISENVHPDYALSAMNLVRYITLRNQDLRKLHDNLSELGISSIRSCEAYVWKNVSSALKLVRMLNGKQWEPNPEVQAIGYKRSKKLLRKHTSTLFDSSKKNHLTKIMVTMPTEAAHNKAMVDDLIANGMQVARINLSHDNIDTWLKMVQNIRTSSTEQKTACRIYMDLSGPKIRTEAIHLPNGSNSTKDWIRLHTGEHLILTTKQNAAADAIIGDKGQVVQPAKVTVSIPSIIADAQVGDRVMFDDGKISSEVIKKRRNELEVMIKNAPAKGVKLKGEKGINLPDSHLILPSLTEADITNLPFVTEHADIVGYSFVRTAEDVATLYSQLEQYNRPDLGIVLKIENHEAFDNLPIMLLEAMKRQKVGVMIARGDLAVEVGAVRIAEVQDQILWICEAAHIPVIWATEVLDTLAKTGKATRAEITDAAKSTRAECVMLNKGPYINEAVAMLSKILKKMEGHTSKKKSIMRALKVAEKNVDRMGNRF